MRTRSCAQVRALQLWSLANRNGQFRIYTNSRQECPALQYSTVALTTGAAIVVVLRWLAELRWAGPFGGMQPHARG